MGFLSDITKSVFGGSDDTGIKAQQQANDRSQAYIQQQTGQARGDAGQLYQQGDYARNLGINLAMALMGQALPQQFNMLQRGQADYQNAILGTPDGGITSLTSPFQYQAGGLPSVPVTQLPNFGQTWNFSAPQSAGGVLGGSQGQGSQGQGSQSQMINMALGQLLGGGF